MKTTEWHVAKHGAPGNPGTADAPFLHIQEAAEIAQPGDTILVHAGAYRERIDPPRGGESDSKRITYQAAPGAEVVITGSERIGGWRHVDGVLWRVEIPTEFFGSFNPFSEKLAGPWFIDNGRDHHLGAVYLDGHWLTEAASIEELSSPAAPTPLWFAEVDSERTVITAQFPTADPNEALVEINVRQSVFYPSRTGIDFLTVRGFKLRHAATPWAAPTSEQIGLIGTNWSKGWIIEENEVSHSVCTGIALGKYHDPADFTGNVPLVEFSQEKDTFHGTIQRALANNWDPAHIGGHLVRNNTVSHCEMAGIAGAFGAIFSRITGNTVHHIHVRQLFKGFEMAGIKFHGAIDTLVADNHVHHCFRGLWLDWMTQGTRVSGNLFHDNGPEYDVFLEVNHGPFVIDNNVCLSPKSLHDWSRGGFYAHNLFAGGIEQVSEWKRTTPWHQPHSTGILGFKNIPGGDNRFYRNVFFSPVNLAVYDSAGLSPSRFAGNLLPAGATPARGESASPGLPGDFQWSLEARGDSLVLCGCFERLPVADPGLVDGASAGKTLASIPYEDFDGSPLSISRDYLGNARDPRGTRPGPFEDPRTEIAVWPKPDVQNPET